MQFWELPGPRTFLESTEKHLRSGYSMAVATPDPAPPSLLDALCKQLDTSGWNRPRVSADTQAPLDTLFDTLALEGNDKQLRNVDILIDRLREYDCQVVVVEGIDASQWGRWRELAIEYERVSRNLSLANRPLLLMLVRGVAQADLRLDLPALKICLWDGVVSEIDMLAYTDLLLRGIGSDGPKRRLAATTIARLALWDPLVAEQLSQLPLTELFAPDGTLAALATERGWLSSEAPAWERGTLANVDGTSHTHSALLALGDHARELEMRLWSAQASIILPLIELHRRVIVKKIRHRLDLPRMVGTEPVSDPFDLEIGELGRAAQEANCDPRITAQIARLRYLRNRLAHLDLLASVDALDPRLHAVD